MELTYQSRRTLVTTQHFLIVALIQNPTSWQTMSEEAVEAELVTTIESAATEVSHLAPSPAAHGTDGDRDDDDYDRRPQRRRYEEPLSVKIRKQLLSIAESVRLCLGEIWVIDTDCRTAIETDRG